MRRASTARHGLRAMLAVAMVLALAGLMFTASARLARGGLRHPQDLAQLVAQRSDRVAVLSRQVASLQSTVDELTAAKEAKVPGLPGREQRAVDVAAGLGTFSGPGVSVSLKDAATSIVPPGASPDDLVVHQQDIQAVVNAMWAGGAEAMTIQGQRVTPLSAVRCVGNVLYLHGQVYSPPYVIAAIGPVDSLLAALDADPSVSIYRQYVDAYGLGWEVTSDETVVVPASVASTTLHEARVPDDDEEHASVQSVSGLAVTSRTEDSRGRDADESSR